MKEFIISALVLSLTCGCEQNRSASTEKGIVNEIQEIVPNEKSLRETLPLAKTIVAETCFGGDAISVMASDPGSKRILSDAILSWRLLPHGQVRKHRTARGVLRMILHREEPRGIIVSEAYFWSSRAPEALYRALNEIIRANREFEEANPNEEPPFLKAR